MARARGGAALAVLAAWAAALLGAAGARAEAVWTGDECAAKTNAWLAQYTTMTTVQNCFDPTSAAHASIQCGSRTCIGAIDAAHLAAAELDAACHGVPEYTPPTDEFRVVAAVFGELGHACGPCVVSFEGFRNVNKSWTAAGCEDALGTAGICKNEACLRNARDMADRWRIMIPGGLCGQYDPGGCGEMGNMTDGQIFNYMNKLFSRIQVYQSLPHLCSAPCGDKLQAWYADMAAQVAPGSSVSGGACITVSNPAARTADQLAQLDYDVHVNCKDDTCVAGAAALLDQFNHLSVGCDTGITAAHKESLALAMHPSICTQSGSWYLDGARYMVGVGVAMALAVIVAVIVFVRRSRGQGCLGCGNRSRKGHYTPARTADEDDNPMYSVNDDKL